MDYDRDIGLALEAIRAARIKAQNTSRFSTLRDRVEQGLIDSGELAATSPPTIPSPHPTRTPGRAMVQETEQLSAHEITFIEAQATTPPPRATPTDTLHVPEIEERDDDFDRRSVVDDISSMPAIGGPISPTREREQRARAEQRRSLLMLGVLAGLALLGIGIGVLIATSFDPGSGSESEPERARLEIDTTATPTPPEPKPTPAPSNHAPAPTLGLATRELGGAIELAEISTHDTSSGQLGANAARSIIETSGEIGDELAINAEPSEARAAPIPKKQVPTKRPARARSAKPSAPARQGTDPSSSAPVSKGDIPGGSRLTRRQVQDTITSYKRNVQTCAQRRNKGDLSGTMWVKLHITPGGEVTSASVTSKSPDFRGSQVSDCVIAVVRGMKFPRAAQPTPIAGYPFVIRP